MTLNSSSKKEHGEAQRANSFLQRKQWIDRRREGYYTCILLFSFRKCISFMASTVCCLDYWAHILCVKFFLIHKPDKSLCSLTQDYQDKKYCTKVHVFLNRFKFRLKTASLLMYQYTNVNSLQLMGRKVYY